VRKKRKSVARFKYRVTLAIEGSSHPVVYTVWAESPEHAFEKAKRKLPAHLTATTFVASEVEV
jgi:hypothetical protein